MLKIELEQIAKQLADERTQIQSLSNLLTLTDPGNASEIAEALSNQIAATARELHERASQRTLALEKGRKP